MISSVIIKMSWAHLGDQGHPLAQFPTSRLPETPGKSSPEVKKLAFFMPNLPRLDLSSSLSYFWPVNLTTGAVGLFGSHFCGS